MDIASVELDLKIDANLKFVVQGDNQNPEGKKIQACFQLEAALGSHEKVETHVFVPIPWKAKDRIAAAREGTQRIIEIFRDSWDIVIRDTNDAIYNEILNEIIRKIGQWTEPRE